MLKQKKIIGWREYIELPDLKIKAIKVKVDTGARTSSLHISELKIVKIGNKKMAVGIIHPKQRLAKPAIKIKVPIIEFRQVKSSNGHVSKRPVIKTRIKLGDSIHIIEMTLVNRDMMGFRMLLGREAVRGKFIVDPGSSYMITKGKKTRSYK